MADFLFKRKEDMKWFRKTYALWGDIEIYLEK